MLFINKKQRITIWIFLITSINGYSQTDSLRVVNAIWESQKIAPGIHLKQYWFRDSSLFQANQFISILEIKKNRRHKIDLVNETGALTKISDFGRLSNAIAAINGGFFNVKGSVDFFRSNGQIIDTNMIKEGKRLFHQKAAVVVKKGRVDIKKWDGSAGWEERLDGDDVMVCGPPLMIDNKVERLDSIIHNTHRHPRSAIASKGRNKVLFIVVDGRNPNAAGMNLFELSKVLKWMGCREGISLDGGGSSALWISGMPDNGIVSHPSDNKKWDHGGERKVANVLIVKKK